MRPPWRRTIRSPVADAERRALFLVVAMISVFGDDGRERVPLDVAEVLVARRQCHRDGFRSIREPEGDACTSPRRSRKGVDVEPRS
jgi:hypothetical protein